MAIAEKIKKTLGEILGELGIHTDKDIHLEHPNDLAHGDFATNLAMSIYSIEYQTIRNKMGVKKGQLATGRLSTITGTYTNPKQLAELITQKLSEKNLPEIASVEVAGPGFINITLSSLFFEQSHKEILEKGMEFGNLDIWKGRTILVEHSSPNLFKPFHIGHMMNNTIGESIKRLCKISGAETTTISYPSDVSLGIGKAVWQLMEYGVEKLDELETMGEKMAFLGKCYADGTTAMKEHPELEPRMREITQDIYEHRDTPAYEAYKIGRDLNLQYFVDMTQRLGSHFDGYIFESEAGIVGKQLVLDNTPQVYTESDGAIVFEPSEEDLAQDKSLHTRVFINKDGNPTYEAKDTGLLKLKFDRYQPDLSVFVTDSEQGPYFNVVSYAAGKINPEWREKTQHMTHGRMKFKGQKMSSRLGNTPIVSDILDTVNELVYEKAEGREMPTERADMISIAALKYVILRTQPGKAINFDPDTSLSFEGDSGPYLQYSYARCQSILRKAEAQGMEQDPTQPQRWQVLDLEKMLYRLPEVIESAFLNYAPQLVANYVTEVAQLFNSWYGQGKILDENNPETAYKLAIVKATAVVIKKSLWVLGIDAPEEM